MQIHSVELRVCLDIVRLAQNGKAGTNSIDMNLVQIHSVELRVCLDIVRLAQNGKAGTNSIRHEGRLYIEASNSNIASQTMHLSYF